MLDRGRTRNQSSGVQNRKVGQADDLVDEWRGEVFRRAAWDSLRPVGVGRNSGRLDRLKGNWITKMMDRTLLAAGWAAVMWFGSQALPISGLAIQPQQVSIEGDQVTLVREFPGDTVGLPRPWLSYVETVRPLTPGHNGGQVCEQRRGPFQYTEKNPVGTWSIEWAGDCLSDPRGFTWSASWTWWIGNVRLGPTDFNTRVLRAPCQYRVSRSGVVHGPDSPHWSQTSTERCFPTRAAAEAATR